MHDTDRFHQIASSHRLPCRWHNSHIIVMEEVVISGPGYEAASTNVPGFTQGQLQSYIDGTNTSPAPDGAQSKANSWHRVTKVVGTAHIRLVFICIFTRLHSLVSLPQSAPRRKAQDERSSRLERCAAQRSRELNLHSLHRIVSRDGITLRLRRSMCLLCVMRWFVLSRLFTNVMVSFCCRADLMRLRAQVFEPAARVCRR